MTIDEAIEYCLDVVEKNDLAADMYDLLEQNTYNTYEKLTAKTNYSHCIKSSSNHKQVVELLEELKELRIKSAIMEKNDNEVKQSLKHLLEHSVDVNYINNRILELYKTLSISAIKELHEVRRLLKLAVGCLNDGGCTKNCDECANYIGQSCGDYDNFKWKYTDDALKLIEGTDTQTSTPDNIRNLTPKETYIYNNFVEHESSYTGVNLFEEDVSKDV